MTREPAAHVTAAVLGITQGRKIEGNSDDSDERCGPHGGHLIYERLYRRNKPGRTVNVSKAQTSPAPTPGFDLSLKVRGTQLLNLGSASAAIFSDFASKMVLEAGATVNDMFGRFHFSAQD